LLGGIFWSCKRHNPAANATTIEVDANSAPNMNTIDQGLWDEVVEDFVDARHIGHH
jgi:hypothetical protein